MRAGMQLSLAVPVIALGAALVGCSPAPITDEVVERFAIELAAATDLGEAKDWAELAEELADDAFDGMCAEPSYRVGLDDADLAFAFDVGCSFYFEDQMSDSQLADMKDEMARRIVENQDE